MDGRAVSRLLGDIVSRNGRLLLNVGPTADGMIPTIQRNTLVSLGRWMKSAKPILAEAGPAGAAGVSPSDEPWVRWLRTPTHLVALVDHVGTTALVTPASGFDLGAAAVVSPVGTPAATLAHRDGGIAVTMVESSDGPAIITIPELG